MPKPKKIQFSIAFLFSLASIIAIPVVAWFVYQSKVETMSYINDPPTLSLASGHYDSAQFFELKNIDVKRDNDGSYSKDFVFSVETEKATEYDLQLAHTTNIPFNYQIFRAKKDDTEGTVEYHVQEGDDAGSTIMYKILEGTIVDGDISFLQDITLTDLNPANASSTRTIGSESVLKSTYNRENYITGDNVNQYVEPLYSVARNIKTNVVTVDGSEDRDYFVLRVTWRVKNNPQDTEYWDYAFNNKETDIIYISVKESQSN